jgi:hypothetical protein
MDRCKDCIHFGICKKGFPFADGKGGGWCVDFKRKVDCVEVVRCKDCRWRNTKGCPYMNFNAVARADNDYCSDGEKAPTLSARDGWKGVEKQ